MADRTKIATQNSEYTVTFHQRIINIKIKTYDLGIFAIVSCDFIARNKWKWEKFEVEIEFPQIEKLIVPKYQ